MQPRFSVITPVLNGIQDVDSYVKSLQQQTFKDWEAVVVDDGSCDGSFERLEQITASDNRFRILRNHLKKQVSGPYQARNMGLDLARGVFVCFLDIDDRWMRNKLAEQHELLIANQQIKLLFGPYLRAKRGESTGKIRWTLGLLSPLCWVHIANPVPMLTACVRKDAIADMRFKPQHHEDYLFWHAVLQQLQPQQVEQQTNPTAVYCVHAESLSGNKFQATYWIWQCYLQLGYNRLLAPVAMLGRGLLQVFLIVREATSPSLKLTALER